MRNKICLLALITICAVLSTSCKKDYLDVKPNSDIVNPQTLADYRLLLDNMTVFNTSPGLLHTAGDEYYITSYQNWLSSSEIDRNASIWNDVIFSDTRTSTDWNVPYQQIYLANVIVEGLRNLQQAGVSGSEVDNLIGEALFNRSFALYNLSQVFCMPYDHQTASTKLGLPLRTSPGIEQIVPRSNLQETFNQITNDLELAVNLLYPNVPPIIKSRSSRPAATALLSRIYLTMADYEKAEYYANETLKFQNVLIDYKTVSNPNTNITPFERSNIEVLYSSGQYPNVFNISVVSSRGAVDTNLYKLYEPNDLRKKIFFQSSNNMFFIKRGYLGPSSSSFSGLATDEVYLNKAECLARRNQNDSALVYLNALLSKRYDTTFTLLTFNNSQDLFARILLERRKELLWRGIRWVDIRRLNVEGYDIILKRGLNGQEFTLSPNSNKYAYPIPPDEISLSGLDQNPR